jgi:hypothetical protein
MWRTALLETVLEIRLLEARRPTGKGRSIGLHGRTLMGCRKGGPKDHILDHSSGVELQEAVFLVWLAKAGRHVHISRSNNEQENLCRAVVTLLLTFEDYASINGSG